MPIYLTNWIIIELTHIVANGTLRNGRTIYTDSILAIIDDYLITEKDIYKLGNPDMIWFKTSEAKQKLEQLSGHCSNFGRS